MFWKTRKKIEESVLNNNAVAANNPAPAKKSTPSIISNGLNILGNLVCDGNVDIDGTVEGNIKSEQVTIRANGKISGDITAEQVVHVYGEVRGIIKAHAVHIYSSARIEGVIIHQTLTVEDGAFVDAKFKRTAEKVEEAGSGFFDRSSSDDQDQGFSESAPSLPLRLIS